MSGMGDAGAFPRAATFSFSGELVSKAQEGMTIREHFAIECMKAILMNPKAHNETGRPWKDGWAEAAAVKHADNLIEALRPK